MADYGEAFKLPFTNWHRSCILFLLVVVAGLPADLAQVFPKGVLSLAMASGLANFIALSIVFVIITVILYIVISGYTVRLTSYASHGKNIMPPFEKPFALLAAGLKYAIALLIYALPLIFLLILLILLLKGPGSLRIVGLVLLAFSVVFALVWSFFMFYSGPMLMAHFAYENRFAAFFELRKILKYSFSLAYFVPWVVAVGYSIGLAIPLLVLILPLALIAQFYPPANLLASIISAVYAVILTPTVSSLYGQAYRDVISAKPLAASAETRPAKPKRSKK